MIEGHRVIFDGTLYRCTRCETRLLTAMQFNVRECPIPPAKKSLREQARERGIKRDDTHFDIETGKRIAPEDTRHIPPGAGRDAHD